MGDIPSTEEMFKLSKDSNRSSIFVVASARDKVKFSPGKIFQFVGL